MGSETFPLAESEGLGRSDRIGDLIRVDFPGTNYIG